MHDCRKTQEDLVDLVFNEVDSESELRMLEEVEACRACNTEYQSIRWALADYDEAALAALPAGSFWMDYHASLERRLDAITLAPSVPFWHRTLYSSFRVPVPLAIAASILFAAVSALAMRSFMMPAQITPKTGTAAAAEVRYVEVPVEKRVVEERVVTRTIYLPTKSQARQNTESVPSSRDLRNMTAQKMKDEREAPARAASLNGFQPPQDVRMTVIKGSFNDEK